MQTTKTILLTGATDGIGLETAKMLVKEGHTLLAHGRSKERLQQLKIELGESVITYQANFTNLEEVQQMAETIKNNHSNIDVLINNAGVFKVEPNTVDGLDVRFLVNTFAAYILTKTLLPTIQSSGRVVNVSSAAQAPVDLNMLRGNRELKTDSMAYAQSKLALTMWTNHLAVEHRGKPLFVSVNPRSFLGSKMVLEAYGLKGESVSIGAEIICALALQQEYSSANGKYFDNDTNAFNNPHQDAQNPAKCRKLVETMQEVLKRFL